MLAFNTLGNISGNRVRISIRMRVGIRRGESRLSGTRRGSDLLSGLGINPHAAQQTSHRLTWLRADAQPVIDPVGLEIQLLVFLGDRIEPAQFLDDPAIARGPLVDRIDTEERPMPAAEPL